MSYISFDSQKKYTLAIVEDSKGNLLEEKRINHSKGCIRRFLENKPGCDYVAVESIGYWYWIVKEIEEAGKMPLLVNPRKAKLMLGMVNKTDKLDARGICLLQRAGTLPCVWMPPLEIRDIREISRTRMVLCRERTRIKNRILSIIEKYCLGGEFGDIKDKFGKKGKEIMKNCLRELPPNTSEVMEILMKHLEEIEDHIKFLEENIKENFKENEDLKLLMSVPGIGPILGVVILLETGDINRFLRSENYISYSGLSPVVKSSGGKVRYGRMRNDCNRYLKWAYSEAANSIAVNCDRKKELYLSQMYKKIKNRKNHSVAIGAVARNIAESVYFILKRKQYYKDRALEKRLEAQGRFYVMNP